MTDVFVVIFLLGIIAVFEMAANDTRHQPYIQRNFFVSSLSPPQYHQKLIVSVECDHGPSKIHDGVLSYEYSVVERCSMQSILVEDNAKYDGVEREYPKSKDTKDRDSDLNIIDALLKWNPNGRFPSKTQAKRSLELGKVLLFNTSISSTSTINNEDDIRDIPTMVKDGNENEKAIHMPLIELQSHIGSIYSVLEYHTVFVLVEPTLRQDRYPSSVTKHMFPPVETVGAVPIVYEDNYLAVVNKPENMTTIGSTGSSGSERANDLQLVLGFLLRPSPFDLSYHPRPVHRLDRRTSGLVLVAKTKESMRKLSKAFATRTVTKTYSALTFERDQELSNLLTHNNNISSSSISKEWLTIDYPIEKRDAVSEVRRVHSLSTSYGIDDGNDTFSLVEVRPKTGRTHQIRRHLSYCLGMPIVGDSKYDKGARHLRTNGMYLCCHSLRFPHTHENKDDSDEIYISQDATIRWTNVNSHDDGPIQDTSGRSGSQLFVGIPLPDKFLKFPFSSC